MVLVHHRGGDEVIAPEGLGHVLVRGERRELDDLALHDLGDAQRRIRGEELRHGEHPHQAVGAVHDEEAVGVLRQLVAPAQIAQHHLERDVLPHRDGVDVHQAAGSVLRVGEHGVQPLAVLLVEGEQDLRDHLVGEVRDEVGDVVGVEGARRRHQRRVVHQRDELGADRLGQLDQHLALVPGVHLGPDGLAALGRDAAQEVGDVGGMKAGDDLVDTTGVAGLQGEEDALEIIRFFLSARLGHDRSAPRARRV